MVRVSYEKSLCVKTVVFPKHIFNRRLQNIFIFQLKIVTVSRRSTAASGVGRVCMCAHQLMVRARHLNRAYTRYKTTARLVADLLSAQNYNV